MRGIALRLEGPMQSWGGPVAGDDRPSLDVPTKSGVLGLVAGAMGIDRAEVSRLARLHAGYSLLVRVDRMGTPGLDYHTTLDVPTAEGKRRKDAVISRRRYLYDASFLSILIERSGAADSLDQILLALQTPRYVPYLGRKACPLSVPVLEPNARVIEGDTWRDLVEQIPVADRSTPPCDIHLDADLAPEISHRARRQRDVLMGSLPRLFKEREVRVVSWAPPEHLTTHDSSSTDRSIDPWFR